MEATSFTANGVIGTSIQQQFAGVTFRATLAGVVNIYDGVDNTGDLVASLAVPVNDVRGIDLSHLVTCNNGIYAELITATGVGVVYHS
jgi:hypothetical protein